MAIRKKVINGKIIYDVFVKIRNEQGKQISKRRRNVTSEREAKRVEYELRSSLDKKRSRVLWDHWVEECLERFRLQYRHSTWFNYQKTVYKRINPHFKSKFLDEITPANIHDLIFTHNAEVSQWHKKGILKYARKLFTIAVEESYLLRNPCAKIKVKVPQVVQKVLSPDEITKLLAQAKFQEHKFYPIWAMALLTGMRSGELYALKWQNIDFESSFIQVIKSWTRRDGYGPTKSAKNRVVPISTSCRLLLKQLQLQSDSEFVLPRPPEWTQGQQAQTLRTFCDSLNITSVKFHDLRATFITQLLRNGVALAKVMSIVGHSELKTTQGYLRLCGHDVKGATDMLGIELPADTAKDTCLASVISITN